MLPMRRILAGACAALAGSLALAGQATPARAGALMRCDDDSLRDRCGQVVVPLDRTGQLAGEVPLHVRVSRF
ncbi:MAG: hypothetical protein WBC33_02610 [Conexibacter sp.]